MRKFYLAVLSIVLLLMPFHAFLTTYLNHLLFDGSGANNMYIAMWKEVLLFMMFLGFCYEFVIGRIKIAFDKLDIGIIAFCVYLLITGLLWTSGGLMQLVYGVKYGLMFLVVFFMVKNISFTKSEKNTLFYLALSSSVIVIAFAISQKFLPEDFLVQFGYSTSHSFGDVSQALAYCQKVSHTDLCRVQSTFSGPNQLGAYLCFILPLVFFLGTERDKGLFRTTHLFVFFMGLFVLYWTFSRASWLGVAGTSVIAFALLFRERDWFRVFSESISFLSAFCLILAVFFVRPEALQVATGGVFEAVFLIFHSKLFYLGVFVVSSLLILISMLRKMPILSFLTAIFNFGVFAIFLMSKFAGEFFWQFILRPSSTQGHYERSRDGVMYMMKYPWGLGLGDAGPASSHFSENGPGFIPESWYLQVGLEGGFLGLLLFLVVLGIVLYRLFVVDNEYGKPLFIGLLALMTHALLLHTFESSAVALSFWIMTGLALASDKKPTIWEKISSTFSHFIYTIKERFK
ncbi:MAG: hypothetical protein N4A36_02605 [Candidatus Gracilibacteria bacterium]|jgi:hypothetical protein|nr:hypothetical protein [Candidatus Gracilibacteria bacterium]